MKEQTDRICTKKVSNDPVALAGLIEQIGTHYELVMTNRTERTNSPLYAAMLFQHEVVRELRIAVDLNTMHNEQWKKVLTK